MHFAHLYTQIIKHYKQKSMQFGTHLKYFCQIQPKITKSNFRDPKKSNSTSARKQILKIAPAQRWVLFWLGTITLMVLCSKNAQGRFCFFFFFPTWHRQNSSTDSRYFLLNKVELTDGRSVRVQTQKPSKDPEKKKRSTECEETLSNKTRGAHRPKCIRWC